MKNVSNYDPVLRKRKEITEKYSYTQYTLPSAPDLPPITPRRRIQLIPKSHTIRNVGDKVNELEKTTILTRPRDPIKDLRREVRKSDERLLFVKSGHSLNHLNINSDYSYNDEIQQPQPQPQPKNLKDKVLEDNSKSHRFPGENSNVYVYRSKEIFTGPASEIQNELNLMKYNINEVNRKRYNKFVKESNIRNQRRPFALQQMNEDIEKYGIEESIARARRDRQYNSLKLKKDEIWWDEFIDSIPEELRQKKTIKFINDFANIHFYNEANITKFVFEFSKTTKLHNICYTLMFLANKAGSFLDEDRLEFIFYKAEKRREKKNSTSNQTIQNSVS